MNNLVTRPVWKWPPAANPGTETDHLALEEPLEIQVDTRPVSVTMRTPGHDEELAAGFLFTEGLLTHPDQLREIRPYPRNPRGNSIGVYLAPDVAIPPELLQRHFFASSSCGICGKASLDAVFRRFPPLDPTPLPSPTLPTSRLLELPDRMRQAQSTFEKTGGLHAAALFTASGDLLALREDIGRHNAVDKVIGWAFLHRQLPLSQHVLLVSGRTSFEILQKALAARIPIVAAISAPSSLAVDFALASNQTLAGFLRPGRFNLYSCPERIRSSPESQ